MTDFLHLRTPPDFFGARFLSSTHEELESMNGYIMGSQNGEDGIIKKLFEIFCIREGYLCEFGSGEGIGLSNTFKIYNTARSFTPILIEADLDLYEKSLNKLKHYEPKIILNKRVSPDPESSDSLDNILLSLNIPDLKQHLRLLSIDVDGPDLQIWESFNNFRPDIVIIEVDSNYPPTHLTSPEDTSGASALSMVQLATRKGYELVCHTGNLIFVTKERYPQLGIEDNSLEKLFDASLPHLQKFNLNHISDEQIKGLYYLWKHCVSQKAIFHPDEERKD